MAIGERIRFFRNLCGMTQKYLGHVVGFPEKTADIRMAQYESGSRTPKADLTNTLAQVFEVSPQALTVPDIDSYIGLMHTLFTLEDIYGELCNGVQREHNKKLNNGLPILHKVPPKRDYGRYFCIMAEKGGTSHGGLTEKLSLFFHAKKQEVNAYGR